MVMQLVLLIRSYNLIKRLILVNASKPLFLVYRKKSIKNPLIYTMVKRYYVTLLHDILQAFLAL